MSTNIVKIYNNTNRTVVKIVATGVAAPATATIALASLVSGDQVVSGIPSVSIIGVITSIDPAPPGYIDIIRNGVIVAKYFGNNDIQYVKDCSFALGEQATSDIDVVFHGDATIIIELRKNDGYTFGENLQNIAV